MRMREYVRERAYTHACLCMGILIPTLTYTSQLPSRHIHNKPHKYLSNATSSRLYPKIAHGGSHGRLLWRCCLNECDTYAYTGADMRTHTQTCTCTCTYLHMRTQTQMHAHKHASTQARKHTSTHGCHSWSLSCMCEHSAMGK